MSQQLHRWTLEDVTQRPRASSWSQLCEYLTCIYEISGYRLQEQCQKSEDCFAISLKLLSSDSDLCYTITYVKWMLPKYKYNTIQIYKYYITRYDVCIWGYKKKFPHWSIFCYFASFPSFRVFGKIPVWIHSGAELDQIRIFLIKHRLWLFTPRMCSSVSKQFLFILQVVQTFR